MAAKKNAKTKLLDAAVDVIRTKGFAATTVDDLCRAAGVTKGAFFHYFESKEALAIAAAGHFSALADWLFAAAPYRDLVDPVERLLGYVEFRKSLLRGPSAEFTCLLGSLVQETYQTHPAIQAACEKGLSEHTAMLEMDIAAALHRYGNGGQWSADGLAKHMQAVTQGAFILAKAHQDAAIATVCLDHLQRYIRLLFGQTKQGTQHDLQDFRTPGAGVHRRAQRSGAGIRAGSKGGLSAHGADSSVPHERSTDRDRSGS
ncbi:MAG TPA: helix-turn-helix domain-containing protein [Steroidobacteraceae bacterium]|nr:helix-turn-helix domain-containing protein [Steroidobacteraceae bacterium]